MLRVFLECTVGSGSVWQWSEGSGAGAVCAAAWRGAGPLAAALASLFTSPAARAAAARHHATYALRAGKLYMYLLNRKTAIEVCR